MTKVAAAAQLPASNALHFGGVAGGGGGSKISSTTLKRKTPSELRGELLKLKNSEELADESPSVTSFMRNADVAVSGPKKSESLKAPRFTRMDEHFPITKISRLLSRKETYKVTRLSSSLDDTAFQGGNDSSNRNNNSTEKCTYNTFKSVQELSQGGEKLKGSSSVDMGRALKGLVSSESRATSAPRPESIYRAGNIVPHSFCSEIHIPGHKIPLDLTLKTNMQVLSSSSVNCYCRGLIIFMFALRPLLKTLVLILLPWFHRLINCATLNSMGLFSNVGCQSQSMTCSSEPTSTSQSHSWVHPQSTLPQAAISALTSAPGVQGHVKALKENPNNFLNSGEDIRALALTIGMCSVQFVVMFTAYDGANKTKCSCYAYISQSTRNLRSLLKEHDVSFSMPLCRSKVEEVTAEDLVELSQIEKHNLGQTRAMESMIGVDNTPQSLLMFTGNKNVHALSFFTSLTGGDVPVLYSPVPFENASLSTPEVRCKQVRRVEYMSSQLKDSSMDSEPKSSSAGICYSVEIRDAYLPPWVICGICDAMRSNGGDFQVSFATESTSIGLNVGLDIIAKDQSSQLAKADKQLQESDRPFGIPNTTLSLQRSSAFVKGLKYGDCSYTAFLSPVE
ncbi:hypothetical protein DH2020_022547 [Rehmannia glutinosa]|uniref:Protein downstream neighbor of Son n=1 Tax=Rehmannia glutinosa TaxID=99300 RepID=A0ABR0WDP7_REHGL